MEGNTPNLSFVAFMNFTMDGAVWSYVSPLAPDVLGYEPHQLVGTSFINIVHPDDRNHTLRLQESIVLSDKVASVAHVRLKKMDDSYVNCVLSQTNVMGVIVGSVSCVATAQALRISLTAQEVVIIAPDAMNLMTHRRWDDLPPLRFVPSTHSGTERECSVRTALLLDRFDANCRVIHVTNNNILEPEAVGERSFFDFVASRDEAAVRASVSIAKSWGVNERTTPSDGGFVFRRPFSICLRGRDSSLRSRLHHSTAGIVAQDFRSPQDAGEILVDGLFSAQSDGLVAVLRLA